MEQYHLSEEVNFFSEVRQRLNSVTNEHIRDLFGTDQVLEEVLLFHLDLIEVRLQLRFEANVLVRNSFATRSENNGCRAQQEILQKYLSTVLKYLSLALLLKRISSQYTMSVYSVSPFFSCQTMKSAVSYTKVSPVEHVIKRRQMYVGSCSQVDRRDWSLVDGRASIIRTKTPYSVFHLFKELTSNVGDNVNNSRLAGIAEGDCTITIEGAWISVRNSGLSIPIEENEDGVLIPVMIFSEMLSGSNLGDEATGGGAHGIGVKAVGALALDFSVSIHNAVQKKSFSCTWKNSYAEVEGPHIGRYSGSKSSVEISYTIDHRLFGYNTRRFSYSEEDIGMFRWIAACLSFTAAIPVHFIANGVSETMNYSLQSYASLYAPEEADRFTIETDTVRCIVLDTPCAGKQLGFCNHIINFSGGTHVKACLRLIKEHLSSTKKEEKGKKGKKEDKVCRICSIKPHITVIISVSITDVRPEFGGGQMKTSLTHPEVNMKCNGKTLSKVLKWGIMKQLDMKTFAKFGVAEASAKKGRHLNIKSGDDAILAGTKDSHLCELHMVEGNSAEGYDVELLNFIPGGRQKVGTFVMRGKLLNVLKATDEQIGKNRELNELAMRLGLKIGVDYEDPKNRKKLRYGKVVIMADADEDGNHIRALIITFFHRFYPSLLAVGFVVDYMTPCLRATKGREMKRFFFEKQYLDWKETVDISKWSVRYFKGLGASKTLDIKQDFDNKKEVTIEYDKEAPSRLELVMGKGEDATDERKKWMLDRDPDATITIGKEIAVSSFLDFFVRNYSHSTLKRNMNTLSDGLTHVARIIIYGAFRYFGRQCTSKRHPRVSDFGGAVGDLAKYHHGESIKSSVITMAQDFVGSNNLPLLIGDGRFGNIDGGGKHASAPRYLSVKPSPLLPLIFRPEDDVLLTPCEVEGKKVEPEFYLPIIPVALLNGVECICTGWAAKIPNYNPLQVIDAYLNRLQNRRFRELTPWYRGYKGTLTLSGNELTCRGIVKFTSEDSYILTCLPVGVWNKKYKKELTKKLFEDKIEDYESLCTATETCFKVTGVKKEEGQKLTLADIGAEVTKKLSNLTLLGTDGLPRQWYSIAALMEDFFEFRLPYYGLRKKSIIAELESGLTQLEDRKAYIVAYLSRKLVFEKEGRPRKREDVLADIEALGLRKDLYLPSPKVKKVDLDEAEEGEVVHQKRTKIVPLHEMDDEGIAALEVKIAAVEKEIEDVRSVSEREMWKRDLLELRAAYTKMY